MHFKLYIVGNFTAINEITYENNISLDSTLSIDLIKLNFLSDRIYIYIENSIEL